MPERRIVLHARHGRTLLLPNPCDGAVFLRFRRLQFSRRRFPPHRATLLETRGEMKLAQGRVRWHREEAGAMFGKQERSFLDRIAPFQDVSGPHVFQQQPQRDAAR